MTILALDIGSKRIGMAVSDPSGTYALPIGTIERTNLKSDLERITECAQSYAARELVVGDPVTLSGERGPAAENVDKFVAALRGKFTGPIHRTDERMTTAQATKSLIAADVSRSRRKSVVDKLAAALILETFLQLRRRAGPEGD